MAEKQHDESSPRPPLTEGAASPNAEVPGQQQPAGGDDERRRRIAEGAYYNAERRGFAAGGELDDWLQAEQAYDKGVRRGKSVETASPPTEPALQSDGGIIEADAVKDWAGRLNVSATRLREAIRNVGSRLPDVVRFLHAQEKTRNTRHKTQGRNT